jgi:hypothetical protein
MSALTHPPRSGRRAPATGRAGGFSGLVWLTWRQHRWALLGCLAVTVLLAGWLLYVSHDMTTLYEQCRATQCAKSTPAGGALWADYGPVRQTETLALVVRYVPLLIGIFVGVPLLAREHEQRTLLLAWSQDISPLRWLWSKLALLGLYLVALTAVLSAVTDHAAHVYAGVVGGGLFNDRSFLVTGMLPLAGSVCWFAIGVALGAVIRRTLPAVFAAVVAYLGVLLGVQWRYPTLMTPLFHYQPVGGSGLQLSDPNALVVDGMIAITPDSVSNLYFSPGHEVTYADLRRVCPIGASDQRWPSADCLSGNHLLNLVTYQPSSRIPAFHLILATGYLGVAAVALAAVWLIVRRTALSAG